MNLRTRFVVVLAGFVLSLTCLAALVAGRVFLSRAAALERDLMREAFNRGRQGLDNERLRLAALVEDWASWNDAYAFMADTNRPFLDSNLVDGTFRTLGLNLIAFFDAGGRSVAVKGFDLERDRVVPPSEPLWKRLLASDRGVRLTGSDRTAAGFLAVPDGVWLVAARPILNSLGEGPARGTLVMARRLSGRAAQADSLWGRITVHACENAGPHGDIVMRHARLRTAKGNGWIPDLDGRHTVMIECAIDRSVFLHGLMGQFYLTGWILLCGAGTGLFSFWIVDRWILQDLAQSLETLKTGIHAIAAGTPLPASLKTSRSDEMGQLSNSLYTMLESLGRSQRSLRLSEAKYRTLAESAPDAIVQLDGTGRVVAGNRAFFETLLGRPEAEAVGQPLARLWPGAVTEAILAGAARAAEPDPLTIGPLTPHAEAPTRWYSARLSRLDSAAPAPPATLVMLRDVTEPMRAQQEAERRRADLIQAQKLTALGTLVAGVAHEVNNPNTVIRLNLAALQRRLAALPRPAGEAADGRGELDALIAEIRDASDRIDSLVASLKAFTRPADPSMTEPVSLSAVIRNAVDLLRHPIAKSRCRLRLDLAEPLPPVIGNAQKLTQVLVNLIQNAVQASPQPDAPITVTARWAETDGCLRVTVQDQGAGIAPDHLDRIFEPFFTTRREQGGTGLGLSISAEIIRAHQGRITAHSQPGQGACFTLDLPVHKEPPHDA